LVHICAINREKRRKEKKIKIKEKESIKEGEKKRV
jgi:hypothetical protein